MTTSETPVEKYLNACKDAYYCDAKQYNNALTTLNHMSAYVSRDGCPAEEYIGKLKARLAIFHDTAYELLRQCEADSHRRFMDITV